MLPICSGVANITLWWSLYGGERFFKCVDDEIGIVCRKCCLGEVDDFFWIIHDQIWNSGGGFQNLNGVWSFASSANHFLVIFVTDQNNLPSPFCVSDGFGMYLGHQWARSVNAGELFLISLFSNFGAHSVGTEHENRSGGDFGNILNEENSSINKALHNVLVVNDLVIHADLLIGTNLKQLIDNVDGHVDTGAEAARIGEDEFHRLRIALKMILDIWVPGGAESRLPVILPSRRRNQQVSLLHLQTRLSAFSEGDAYGDDFGQSSALFLGPLGCFWR